MVNSFLGLETEWQVTGFERCYSLVQSGGAPEVPPLSYKIAEFELDCARFELRHHGQAVKLEPIPLELLILLVERNGEVVSRQEIIERIWGKDFFIDTEHGINTAIRKIRAS